MANSYAESSRDPGSRLLLTYLLSAAWLGTTLLFTVPGTLYLSNSSDFTLGLKELLFFIGPLFLGGMLLAAFLWVVVPQRLRLHLTSVTFAIALLFWLQGNVFLWDYGPLDGRSIDWDMLRGRGYIDGVVWILVLFCAVLMPRRVLRPAISFISVVIIASLGLFGFAAMQQRPDTEDSGSIKHFQIDDSRKFDFSTDSNAILIVADAMQSDVFKEITTDPAYSNVFEGFTFFPDAVAASNFTSLSVPAILTGRMYDNSVPRGEYMRDAFMNHGVTTQLKRKGFDVEIYPWVGWGNETIYFDEAVASNLRIKVDSARQEDIYSEQNAKEVLHLLDLTIFRGVPHFLKPTIYNNQNWFLIQIATAIVPTDVKQTISTDNRYETNVFVKEAVDQMTARRNRPVFKYFHVKGAHMPLTVDSDLNFADTHFPYNRQNYINSVKANIISLGEFLQELKEQNIFDNSLILIVGDHGSGNSPDVYINPGQNGMHLDGSRRNFPKDKARGVPVILVKRPGSEGPMLENQAPVALVDVPVTIIDELGVATDIDGRSMFDIEPTESRNRYFGAFDYSATHSEYVGVITLYQVSGNSWLDASWSFYSLLEPRGQPVSIKNDAKGFSDPFGSRVQ